jgi:small subunit ribosomal protein S6
MSDYEVMFIADPRLSEEEVVELSETLQGIIRSGGGVVVREESWGKRKLAYSINKLTEGRYVLLEVRTNGENPFPELEQRMEQNEKILRYLTVRTDAGRLRRREKSPAGESQPEEGKPRMAAEKEVS